MLTHFEKYYIGNLQKDSQTIRKVPFYPIKCWTCYDRVLKNSHLTTNMVKSWHKQFHKDCWTHSTVYKVIKHFQLEQNYCEFRKAQADGGLVVKFKRNKQIEKDTPKNLARVI